MYIFESCKCLQTRKLVYKKPKINLFLAKKKCFVNGKNEKENA